MPLFLLAFLWQFCCLYCTKNIWQTLYDSIIICHFLFSVLPPLLTVHIMDYFLYFIIDSKLPFLFGYGSFALNHVFCSFSAASRALSLCHFNALPSCTLVVLLTGVNSVLLFAESELDVPADADCSAPALLSAASVFPESPLHPLTAAAIQMLSRSRQILLYKVFFSIVIPPCQRNPAEHSTDIARRHPCHARPPSIIAL